MFTQKFVGLGDDAKSVAKAVMLRVALLSWVVLTCAGCGAEDSNATSNYVHKLANVLKVDTVTSQTKFAEFPRPRELQLRRDEITLGIREFLSIKKCQLHSAIAEKNSLLGKLSTSSQALLIDLRMLHHAPACIVQLRQDKQVALANKLERLINEKESRLPSILWQAVLGSDENRSFWSPANPPSDYPNAINNSAAEALQYLSEFTQRVLAKNYRLSKAEEAQFERNLGLFRNGDGGLLLAKYAQLAAGLEAANQLIEQRVDRALCLRPSPTAHAKHLQNVVVKFFIGQVQVEAVALTQRYRQLIQTYQDLENQTLHAAPKAYRSWVTTRQLLFDNGLSASKRHVVHIQKIYSQCGLHAG